MGGRRALSFTSGLEGSSLGFWTLCWAAAGGGSPWRGQFLATPQPASLSSHTKLGAPDTDIQGEKGVLAGSSGLTLKSGHQGHLQQHRKRGGVTGGYGLEGGGS